MKHFSLLLILPVLTLIFTGGTGPCPAQTPPAAHKHNPQAQAHSTKGFALVGKNDLSDALLEFQAAYELDKVSFPEDAAGDLYNVGMVYDHLSQYDKAAQFFQQALPIFQKFNDRQRQANDLNNLGTVYDSLSQYDKAIQYFQQALLIHQQIEDIQGQMDDLDSLGIACDDLSQYDKASTFYQQALTMHTQVKDLEGQAIDLNSLGLDYESLSQNDKAITFYQQALPIYQKAQDIKGQAEDLTNLGNAYSNLSQYEKAITFYQQSLSIYQQVKDADGQAEDLDALGNAYDDLSQYVKAILFYKQALALHTQVKDLSGQASDLGNAANVFSELNQDDDAINFYKQALVLDVQIKDIHALEKNLGNLGNVYDHLSQFDKAITLFQQAITLSEQIKDLEGQAADLTNLGSAYGKLGQSEKAIQYFQQAIPIYQQIKDRAGLALTLNNLMDAWQKRDTPVLAIFYGKQAVNVYQSIRQDISTMDQKTQKTYLKEKEPAYRQLAELLIKQGRIPEAEQVLGLLKDQEFYDFVRRSSAISPTAGEASLTPVETAWQIRYAVIADKITTIGQTKQDLLTKQQQATKGEITLTPTEKADLQKNLTQADTDLTVANKAFQDFLTQIATESQDAPKAAQDRVQTVTEAAAFEDTLRQLGPGVVALYTIVEPDKVRILVVTSQTQVAREYPIKDTDLREKVAAFRKALQEPDFDPRPLAHDLYTILVAPVEQDLAGAKATTLMWSLDDVLRYVPMAALYDGKQYLVERYQNEVFTPASDGRLTDAPQAQWNGLGLGVSKEYPGFAALIGVPQELDDVIHDPNITASQTGALPGTILLNGQFTQQAMTQALEGHGYPLVHIASHFDFQPGDETNSFLLLGDGSHLSLADIKTLPQVFQGVDLLTLSACDTANGSAAGADGREVEGFAVLAQRQGAKAVIASLWPVADASTPLLMETFYKQHAAVPNQSKAEDLRDAQLALLHGTVSGPVSSTDRAKIVPDKKAQAATTSTPFVADPKAPYAHPYYWAPFILIGNWK